jgi:hypothetical protein
MMRIGAEGDDDVKNTRGAPGGNIVAAMIRVDCGVATGRA